METIINHPIYNEYGCDCSGNTYSLRFNKILKIKQHPDTAGYLGFNVRYLKKNIRMRTHKFIYECFYGIIELSNKNSNGLTINHINNNKLDNSIINLELCTFRENLQKKTNKTSKYTGVSYVYRKYDTSPKYRCKHSIYHIGMFNTEIEAAIEYDNWYEKKYGYRPNKTLK